MDHPGHHDVPYPAPNLSRWTKLLVDQGLLGLVGFAAPKFWIRSGQVEPTIEAELYATRSLYEERGWLDEPRAFHRTPTQVPEVRIKKSKSLTYTFEHLSFESGYQPDELEPCGPAWAEYLETSRAHAWVLRADNCEEKPWVIAIHGFAMGKPWMDLGGLAATWLHETHDVNVVSFVMPLHGPRLHRGRRFEIFDRGITNIVQAEAQAMWDLRSLVNWIRSISDQPIGAYGISLGGYTTALLASLEDRLAFAIPGVPATCFVELFLRNLPDEDGSDRLDFWNAAADVLRVISPLTLDPVVPKRGRFIFGGLLDGLTPIDAVRNLWLHWERPDITWYAGSHVSFFREPEVLDLLGRVVTSRKAQH